MDDAQADRDASLLLDMLLAARDARSFLSGLIEEAFMTSRLHQNAVIRSLEVIGEAAGKISSETHSLHPEIPTAPADPWLRRGPARSGLDGCA